MQLPNLSELTENQLNQAARNLPNIVADETLDTEQRKEAQSLALLIADEIDSRRTPITGLESAAKEAKGLRQRTLSSLLDFAGIPTDMAVSAADDYFGSLIKGANPIREKIGKDEIPTEVPSFGEEKFGLPTGENLKRSTQALGELVGIDMLGDYTRPAEGIGERTGEFLGPTIAGGAGILNLARNVMRNVGLKTPKNITEFLSKNIVDFYKKNPTAAVVTDAASAPAMALARYGTEEGVIPEVLGPTAELVAGMTPAAAASLLEVSPTVQAAKKGVELTKDAIQKGKAGIDPSKADPLKGEGARAAKVLAELVEDPDKVIRRLDASTGDKNLTVAQRTEDKLLTSLEAKIIRSAEGETGINRKSSEGQETIRKLTKNIIDRGTNINDTVKYAKARIEGFRLSIKGKLQEASEELNQTLNKIRGNNIDKTDDEVARASSVAIDQTLRKSLDDVAEQEAKMWFRMPMSIKGSQENLVKKVLEIQKGTGRAQLEDIPSVVNFINTNMYKRNGKLNTYQESAKELRSLYIKLGEVSRKALRESDFNRSRIAEDLQSAILKDMDGWSGKGAGVNTRIKEAREFSKLKNQYFRKGTVGKLLGYKSVGGGIEEAVRPELLAETILRGSSAARLQQVLDLSNAEKFALSATNKLDDAELGVLSGLSDYIKSKFLIDAFDDVKDASGKVTRVLNPSSAKNFLKANREVLELVPETRVQLMRARDKADVLKRITKTNDAYMNSISSKSDSTLAKLVNYDPDVVIRKILNSDRADKMQQMQLLVNLASKDKSAKEGLKNALARYLVDETTKQNATISGRPMINANQMYNRLLDDKNLDQALRLVFDASEMKSIRYAAKQMKNIQDSILAAVDVNADTSVTGTLLENLVGFAGVRAGGAAGGKSGSSLVMAGMGRRLAERVFRDFNPDKARYLLSQAFKDEELMKILLRRAKEQPKGTDYKGAGAKFVSKGKELLLKLTPKEQKVLRAYMVAPIVGEGGDEKAIEERTLRNQAIIDELLSQ